MAGQIAIDERLFTWPSVCLQLHGDAGARQVPGPNGDGPKAGYTQVYAAPGTGACTILAT